MNNFRFNVGQTVEVITDDSSHFGQIGKIAYRWPAENFPGLQYNTYRLEFGGGPDDHEGFMEHELRRHVEAPSDLSWLKD